jgi:hypothetical protein
MIIGGGDVEMDYAYGISLGYCRDNLLSVSLTTPHFPHDVVSESKARPSRLTIDSDLLSPHHNRIQDTNHRSGREPSDEIDIRPSKSIYAVI